MSKKLKCIVSGKELTITDSYYQKKLDKAGNEKTLHDSYICKEAKKLLRIGNSVKKVRELLDIKENLPDVDDNIINDIVFKGKKKNFLKSDTDFISLTGITHSQTDVEVKKFIDKINK